MDDATAERVVPTAVEAGYRLIDTAENYENERGVGRGLRASGVPREELFVTTKFNKQWHSVDGARRHARRASSASASTTSTCSSSTGRTRTRTATSTPSADWSSCGATACCVRSAPRTSRPRTCGG